MDFDLLDNNLHSVFGVRKVPKEMKSKLKDKNFIDEFRLNEKNVKELIVKVDKKIDLIANPKLIFDDEYIVDKNGINEMLNELKNYYDLILIDTASDTKYKEINSVLANFSNKIICLIEGNIIYTKKNIRILNDNIKQKDKISIVYNKKNKYTVSKKFLEILFFGYKVIGVLSYDNRYSQIVNKNVNRLYITKEMRKEFKKIIKRL